VTAFPFSGRASTTHRKALEVMMKECGYSEHNIPQLEDVSAFLKSKPARWAMF
jgi:hypothetical protein